MDQLIAKRSDEDVAYALKFYENEINRYILTQFIMHKWQKQPRNTSQEDFASAMLSHVDNNKMKSLVNQRYMNLIGDDNLVYFLSFLCDDDKLIHKLLTLLNKRFNNGC